MQPPHRYPDKSRGLLGIQMKSSALHTVRRERLSLRGTTLYSSRPGFGTPSPAHSESLRVRVPSLSPASLQHFLLKRRCWGSWAETHLPPPFCALQVRNAPAKGPGGKGFQLDSWGAEPALARNHRSHLLLHGHPKSHSREGIQPQKARPEPTAFNCPEADQCGPGYGIWFPLDEEVVVNSL